MRGAKMKMALILCGFALLSGCASVIEGESQEISISTTPEGAHCAIMRKDASIAVIASTPGAVHVEKTKDNISVKCGKAGYQEAIHLSESGYPEYNWAYILVGGPIGWGIDSATGADNEYAASVHLDLLKK